MQSNSSVILSLFLLVLLFISEALFRTAYIVSDPTGRGEKGTPAETFTRGNGIKCWVCRSDSDPKCSDPFDNSTVPITDCKQEPDLPHILGVRPTMCRKIRQKVNGEWRYFRSCAYLGEPGIEGDERFCLMRTGTFNIFMEYCTCNTKDGCNSARSITASLLFIAATVSTLYLIST